MTQPRQPGDAPPRIISGSDQAANEAVPPAQQTPSAGQQPPPTAARPPDAPVQPGDKSMDEMQVKPDESGEDLSARAAQLEEELASVRARASGQETVRVKVEGPHSGIIHNGLYVGNDWTDVPVHALPAMMEGAANSGVTLTQEETES